jgi:hypothetical protein
MKLGRVRITEGRMPCMLEISGVKNNQSSHVMRLIA